MIDTVILFIDAKDYFVTDPMRFSPPLRIYDNGAIPYTKHIANPNVKDGACHYYPRITLYHHASGGNFTSPLKIEFSAPKLIFGNNVDELDNANFEQVVEALRTRCAEMGVDMSDDAIRRARVNAIHFSKNILLSAGYTSTLAIREIAKMNSSIMRDHNKADFRNEGHAYQIYTHHRAIVFYDKVNDAFKSKTKRIDKEQGLQVSYLQELKKTNNQLEILRIEIRLTNYKAIQKDLVKVGVNIPTTFKGLFDDLLAKKVIQSYWTGIYDPRCRFISSLQQSPQAVLKNLLDRKPQRMTVKSALELIGLYFLARDDAGLLGLRNVIQSHRPEHNWHRLKQKYAAFKEPEYPLDVHGFVNDIETQLNVFRPIRMLVANIPEVRHNHQ